MKLALTGGTGFVGSHLLDAALADGHRGARARPAAPQPRRDGVTGSTGALDDRDALDRAGRRQPTR